MKLEYENKKPVLKLEENDVSITVVFSDNPQNTNLKKTILDLLISAYENRVTAKTQRKPNRVKDCILAEKKKMC